MNSISSSELLGYDAPLADVSVRRKPSATPARAPVAVGHSTLEVDWSADRCASQAALRPVDEVFHASPGPARVLILDDDERMLKCLACWLEGEGFQAEPHRSAASFFKSLSVDGPACIVLDLHLGNTDGFSVLSRLKRLACSLPVIVLTGHADVPITVRAMRAGAFDVLAKPHDQVELLAAIRRALQHARVQHNSNPISDARRRVGMLTPRERAVLSLILHGRLNKQVADHLGIALVTVKVHRARALRKLGIRTAAELGRIAPLIGLTSSLVAS